MRIDERKAYRLRWWAFGALSVCVIAVFAGAVLILNAHGFSARAQPGAVESWVARRARSAALPAGAKERSNPVPDSPEVLAEARAHWADHCAACHSNNGSGDAQMGKHMYPPAPDMRQANTQNLTDGELLYVIQNGIRFTGMPAWGGGSDHATEDSWKLVRFIRHLPKLTTDEEAEMQELNPKSPAELIEEQQEKDFLNGDQTHEHPPQQHH
jgi:mono/diheme cytochrome c family protein